MKRPQQVKPEIEPLLEFISRRAEGIDIAHAGDQFQPGDRQEDDVDAAGYQQPGWNNDDTYESRPSNREINIRCPDSMCRSPKNAHQLYLCPRLHALDLDGRMRKAFDGDCN